MERTDDLIEPGAATIETKGRTGPPIDVQLGSLPFDLIED